MAIHDRPGAPDERGQRLCHDVAKSETKGRQRAEVDTVIRRLTGYSDDQLQAG